MTTVPDVAATSRRRRGRELFALARPVLNLGSRILAAFPRSVADGFLSLVRNVPGYPGLAVRYMCIRRLAASCGDNVAVYPGVHLFDLDRCHLGSNIKIGEMSFVGASGGLTIEDDVSLAHGTSVLTEEHDYRQPGPLRETELIYKPVHIERDVWVGAGVRVLAGAHIGRGAAVGAGSVVKGSIPEFAVAAGAPARVLRQRFSNPDG